MRLERPIKDLGNVETVKVVFDGYFLCPKLTEDSKSSYGKAVDRL